MARAAHPASSMPRRSMVFISPPIELKRSVTGMQPEEFTPIALRTFYDETISFRSLAVRQHDLAAVGPGLDGERGGDRLGESLRTIGVEDATDRQAGQVRVAQHQARSAIA